MALQAYARERKRVKGGRGEDGAGNVVELLLVAKVAESKIVDNYLQN